MTVHTSTDLRTTFLFPGQGGFDGAALRLAKEKYPQVRQVFERIDAETMNLFSRRITDVLFGDHDTDLRELLNDDAWASQVAIYAAGLASYEILEAQGVRPDVLAGHSLGEITALVAAGAFSVEDGVRIVAQRVAVIQRQNGIEGRMVALSAGAERAGRLLDLLDDPMLAVATENHDEQTVVSGPGEALDRVIAIAGQLGIGAIEIDTPFPFHTPALAPAVPEFATYVGKLDQHPLRHLVYSPILQRYYEPDDALADRLAEHFVTPVRFAAAVRHLQAAGVTTFVEAGGRAALSKLVVRLTKGSDVRALPSFSIDADGGLALDATLRILRDAGLADATGAPGLAELLAPTVPTDVFDAYWSEHGDEVLRRIADDLGSFTPRPAAAPAAPSTPAPSAGAPDRAEIHAELRTLYAEALEYPEEVFEDGVQLEAELGVDSVKQVELLARASKQYGLPTREAGFRLENYNTMDKIVDFVVSELSGREAVAAG
ncbi:acyltransferase domain-containing protein [Streptomyces durmitorensis]|uniref:[acyl-carrier-protein] S-malonyltransferase n=1 Tax=Streptomyces durmitorensis TaxID=319947 RepID=A0ABY4PQC8_9ACTN|nr:acyltransferase domain-containing protein [Streptomyces durmitorensis]UQT55394.1 acyltransferase domain-containing protein [Streptomyces durmitorensis]